MTRNSFYILYWAFPESYITIIWKKKNIYIYKTTNWLTFRKYRRLVKELLILILLFIQNLDESIWTFPQRYISPLWKQHRKSNIFCCLPTIKYIKGYLITRPEFDWEVSRTNHTPNFRFRVKANYSFEDVMEATVRLALQVWNWFPMPSTPPPFRFMVATISKSKLWHTD